MLRNAMNRYRYWNEERIEAVRKLAARGLSATEIGAKLGKARGSICNIAWRKKIRLSGGKHPWCVRKIYR